VGTDSNGFSLFELMIIIAILGLTMAMAAPSLVTMIDNNRISASANDFIAGLQFAKAESASRVNPVTICKKNAGGDDCVAGGDWSQGWIVFSDTDGDASVDGGEVVLLNHEALNPKITFGGTAGVQNSITYRPSGSTSITSTEVLMVCDDRGYSDVAKGILVTITGRGSVIKASETGQGTCL